MIERNSISNEKIEDAFRKLQQYIYFENTDLHIRSQLADFIEHNGLEKFRKLLYGLNDNVETNFKPYLEKINLRYYPKKVCENLQDLEKKIPSNFIYNGFANKNSTVNRLSIFCDVPIELHIMAVLWVNEFGYILDRGLSSNSLGNRILLHNGKINVGRTLFKPYVRQYQKWWSKGIKKAEELLKDGENVTIVNFDIKDYFHSVELDFNVLEAQLEKRFKNIRNEPLHILFKRIHLAYKIKLEEIEHPSHSDYDRFPLPVGLLSSFVLGNWYLRGFDRYISKTLIPSYYGRYVDDIFIVLKERLITRFTEGNKNSLVNYFAKFNIKVKLEDRTVNTLNYFLFRYLSNLLEPSKSADWSRKPHAINYTLKLQGLENLTLQDEKIFVYQFNAKLSPNLISRFSEEQKERSSEFRFLSDEEDENFDDFEDNIFEYNFETSDLNRAKFRLLEENKFKLSVYFAKLIQRRIERGEGYKDEEIEKIEKYFKGNHLLKYYFFWEKLFTLYAISGKRAHFVTLISRIKTQISKLDTELDIKVSSIEVKKHLYLHLQFSICMALGYKPDFIDLKTLERLSKSNLKINPLYFRSRSLLRKQFIYYPLLQLTAKAKNERFSLIDTNVFETQKWTHDDFEILNGDYVPYRVKFYEVALLKYREVIHASVKKQEPNQRFWYNDLVGNPDVLNSAFSLFYKINNPKVSEEDVKKEYFELHKISHIDELFDVRKKVELTEMYFKNSGNIKKKYRIGLVNKYVAFADYEASLLGQPIINRERIETFDWTLDQLGSVKNLDLFVMPELSLPHPYMKQFVRFSAKNQIAFVSGVEHLKVDNIGFNFVMTCLPVKIDGDKDAIPILRLKNHYAPDEELWVEGKYMTVPKPDPYRYDLFEWRGLYFSSYYCYELANIFHRSVFTSMVDLICAPVWNADTHYYSNIIESATRDMHCYFAQVNTSQYGDSRVTRPTDHIRKDKIKVTGGTVQEYKVTVLVSDIDVEALRSFQSVAFTAQKLLNANKKSFKPTPPDFDLESVAKRRLGKRFGK